MAHRVCPWYVGYVLLSPLRRLWEDPRRLLERWVLEGMTVVEPGCGMGYFTLELARLVGPHGRVVALDVQPRMLAGLRRRAARAGLTDRIDARLVGGRHLGLSDLASEADLAVAIHVVHEVPDQLVFLGQLFSVLRPGGRLLLVEPRGHVSPAGFAATAEKATDLGFRRVSGQFLDERLRALLEKPLDVASKAGG